MPLVKKRNSIEKNRLSPSLVTLLILLLLSTIVINGCSKHSENKSQSIRLASYNGNFYWVDEGSSLENYPIGPDILEVDYNPTISTEDLFLQSLVSKRSSMLNLEEFEKFINSGTVREATQNEKMNAELYKEKIEKDEIVKSIKIEGVTLKLGDLADYVFQIFTPDLHTEEPFVARDEYSGEILFVTHKYSIKGVEYDLVFRRRPQASRDSCYSCPYRLDGISVNRNKSLTFKEYIKKYWVKNKG